MLAISYNLTCTFHKVWPQRHLLVFNSSKWSRDCKVSTLPLDPTEMLWGPDTPFHAQETAHMCALKEKTLESLNSKLFKLSISRFFSSWSPLYIKTLLC